MGGLLFLDCKMLLFQVQITFLLALPSIDEEIYMMTNILISIFSTVWCIRLSLLNVHSYPVISDEHSDRCPLKLQNDSFCIWCMSEAFSVTEELSGSLVALTDLCS